MIQRFKRYNLTTLVSVTQGWKAVIKLYLVLNAWFQKHSSTRQYYCHQSILKFSLQFF